MLDGCGMMMLFVLFFVISGWTMISDSDFRLICYELQGGGIRKGVGQELFLVPTTIDEQRQ